MQGSADRSCKGRGRQHFGPGGHVGYTAAPLFGPRGRRGHASQTRGELGASRAELRKHHAHGGRWVRALFFPHRCPRYFVNCRAVQILGSVAGLSLLSTSFYRNWNWGLGAQVTWPLRHSSSVWPKQGPTTWAPAIHVSPALAEHSAMCGDSGAVV